jgi:hypothetical protein
MHPSPVRDFYDNTYEYAKTQGLYTQRVVMVSA